MAVEYDDLGVTVEYGDCVVSGADRAVELPWTIRTAKRVGDRVALVLQPGRAGAEDPDFELDDGLENLVAVGPGATHEWTVEPVGTAEPGEGDYHKTLTTVGDRLITRRYAGGYHEFDPATGEHLGGWDDDEFRIGERTVGFPDDVGQVVECDGVVVANTGGALWGFDGDGERLWRRDVDHRWVLAGGGRYCGMWTEPTMGKKMEYRLDVRTGRIVEADRSPLGDAKEILDLAEPSLVVGGASRVVTLLDVDRTVAWQVDPPGTIEQALEFRGRYLVRTSGNVVVAMDADGTELWRRDEPADCTLQTGEEGLVLTTDDGSLRLRLDVDTGEVVAVPEGPEGITADDVE